MKITQYFYVMNCSSSSVQIHDYMKTIEDYLFSQVMSFVLHLHNLNHWIKFKVLKWHWLALTPDITRVTSLVLHFLNVIFSFFPVHVTLVHKCFKQCIMYISCHVTGITEKNKIKNFILSKRAITPSKWSDQYAWDYGCGV